MREDSRLKILVDAETLYKFQIAQPAYDNLIKTLLRSYGGLFEHFAAIKESEVSKRADLSTQEVRKMLEKMQEMDLLSYAAQTDQPQLQFLRPRMDREHLAIDHQFLKERQQIHRHQIQSVIQFAQSNTCRSQQLLAYFNEQHAPVCGVCDVCLAQKKAGKSSQVEQAIRKEIISLLSEKAYKLEELIPLLKSGEEDQRLAQFRQLLDSGQLKNEGELFSIDNKQ